MLLHEKSGRKLSVRLRYKEVWRNSEEAGMKISLQSNREIGKKRLEMKTTKKFGCEGTEIDDKVIGMS